MANIYTAGDSNRNWAYHQSMAKPAMAGMASPGELQGMQIANKNAARFQGGGNPAARQAKANADIVGTNGQTYGQQQAAATPAATTTTPATSVTSMAANAAGVPNYQTSIDANPIWSQQQKQAAANQARTSAVQQIQSPSGAAMQNSVVANTRMGPGSGFARAMTDNNNLMARFMGERAGQEADRDMTQANASHVLQAQQGRAQEGLSLANMLQSERMQQQAMQFQQQQAQQNMGMNLLSSMLGGVFG